MNNTLESLELILDEEVQEEDGELLHLVCFACTLWDPDVCLCGVLDARQRELGKEYLRCIVCWDFWEQGVCPEGHALKGLG